MLSFEAYNEIHASTLEVFLPTLNAVARDCRLPPGPWERLGVGRNLVFALGQEFILKLTPPFWWQREERAALPVVHGKLPLETPKLVAAGETEFRGEAWSYLVQTRVAGSALHEHWRDLSDGDKIRLAAANGDLLRQLHALRWTESFPEALSVDWSEILTEQRRDLERELEASRAEAYLIHQISGAVPVSAHWRVPERLIADIASFLDQRFSPVSENPERILLHGDLNPLNLMVNEALEPCGIVDFSDAKLGPREHDLISPIMNFYYQSEAQLEAFLSAYGNAADRAEVFVRCLLWYGPEWAHRLGVMFGDHSPESWQAVSERLRLL